MAQHKLLVVVVVVGGGTNDYRLTRRRSLVLRLSFQGVSPLYVGLNPGPHHLASALHHLLLANNWLPVTLIVDDSLDAQKIRQVVQQHPSDVDKVTDCRVQQLTFLFL